MEERETREIIEYLTAFVPIELWRKYMLDMFGMIGRPSEELPLGRSLDRSDIDRYVSKCYYKCPDLNLMIEVGKYLEGLNLVGLGLTKGTNISIEFWKDMDTNKVTLKIPYHAGLKEIILKRMGKMRGSSYCPFSVVYK